MIIFNMITGDDNYTIRTTKIEIKTLIFLFKKNPFFSFYFFDLINSAASFKWAQISANSRILSVSFEF